MASDESARYDDRVTLDAGALEPHVTWGINPGQSVGVSGRVPRAPDEAPEARAQVAEALDYMGFGGGETISGTKIDVAFIGSCTNGRLSDLREASRVVKGRKVAPHVKALVVPGSNAVRAAAEKEGLDAIFRDAGFEWRGAGCSMCLAMNPDKLEGRQVCASSSNRNFKGRPVGLPCRPLKLRFDEDAHTCRPSRLSGFIPRHIEQTAPRHSKPASRKIASRPSFSAAARTAFEPGTTSAFTCGATLRPFTTRLASRRSDSLPFVQDPMNATSIFVPEIVSPPENPM